MKKIFIPMSIKSEMVEPLGRTHFARATYIKRILQADLMPLLLSPLMSQLQLEQVLKEASGILLMGGDDVDPVHYNEKEHPCTEKTDPARDVFELSLASKALIKKIPIFGICRGIQVLAVASGGALIQHVPDLKIKEEHGMSEGTTYDHLQDSPKHLVNITKGSRAHKIVGSEQVLVNSAHHQAVKSVGHEFVITGVSPEGITEIIEHKDASFFAFGVQSHPEAEIGSLEPFFTEFFSAAKSF